MLPFLSARRESGWAAIVSNGKRIDVAHVLRAEGARPEIVRLESFAADRGVADALKRLKAGKKLPNANSTTLLAGGQYHLSQFETPAVPAEERAEALRWRFKDMVDFPVESACIGVLDIPFDPGLNRQAMVHGIAVSRAVLEPLIQMFDAAKVPLVAIDLPELAQRNVAALFEDENRGLAFLCFDEQGGMLTITYRGELYAMRRMDISAAQLVAADAERREQLLERVMLELQRTLDNFDRQYSFISVAGLVLAACPAVPELLPYLSQNLYVPVRPMDLAQVCDFSGVPELRDMERQAQCLYAIGAALRTPGAI